jgi:hypothetical protein
VDKENTILLRFLNPFLMSSPRKNYEVMYQANLMCTAIFVCRSYYSMSEYLFVNAR